MRDRRRARGEEKRRFAAIGEKERGYLVAQRERERGTGTLLILRLGNSHGRADLPAADWLLLPRLPSSILARLAAARAAPWLPGLGLRLFLAGALWATLNWPAN